jgi:RNA polymerase sigma-70 factor (ECF subfamily)
MEKNDTLQTQFLASFDAYGDAIYRFCLLKVSRTEVAQDLTQEVFIRYWQSLLKGEDFKNERAFLYTIARNLVIDWYRKRKDQSLDAVLESGIDFKGDGIESVTKDSEISEVLTIIEQLDSVDREVLLLRYVEGFSPKEISKLLSESTNVISVRIHRAIKKVQDSMGIESKHGRLDLS